jgi:hypothetical protein
MPRVRLGVDALSGKPGKKINQYITGRLPQLAGILSPVSRQGNPVRSFYDLVTIAVLSRDLDHPKKLS